MHGKEKAARGPPPTDKCILCGQVHKHKKENPLPTEKFKRLDDTLTDNGRTYIKKTAGRAAYYPKADDGKKFVSPLEAPDFGKNFVYNTYLRGGKKTRRAEKFQLPPIRGYIAAPHHMIALQCMNGGKDVPKMPRVNAWAQKAKYDINGGQNCIFLPSSATQFFVAYYYWKVRKTGSALQGHIGGHRKIYFKTVWDNLERIPRDVQSEGLCKDTSTEEKRKKLAEEIEVYLHDYEDIFFEKLAAMKPDDEYRLNAESYIKIPAKSAAFGKPEGYEDTRKDYEPTAASVEARLNKGILPEADSK
jgi:HNH/ENDO VII superfamily nuclease